MRRCVHVLGPQSINAPDRVGGDPATEGGAIVANGAFGGEWLPSSWMVIVSTLQCAVGQMLQDEPRFVIDGHLGRVNAGHLRMPWNSTGASRADSADDELEQLAADRRPHPA